MRKVFVLLLMSLIVMPLCIGVASASSGSCLAGSLLDPRSTTCYSTEAEAVLAVPSYITPKDCFVWKDALPPWSLTHPWTVIPGYGCAHWVAHQLNIKHGEGCYVGYSIRIDDIISGRTEITDLRCCKVGDIWTTNNKGHSGIVRQVDLENKKVEVESCSSKYGGVGKEWRSSGICWRDGSCEGTSCGDNAHCSADCKCKCDDGYKDCDENWSNGCECSGECCGAGTPNAIACYDPSNPEDGCCQYKVNDEDKCYEGNHAPDKCDKCYNNSEWHKGWWCEEGECVPEASTLVLLATGLLFLVGYLRLSRKEN